MLFILTVIDKYGHEVDRQEFKIDHINHNVTRVKESAVRMFGIAFHRYPGHEILLRSVTIRKSQMKKEGAQSETVKI